MSDYSGDSHGLPTGSGTMEGDGLMSGSNAEAFPGSNYVMRRSQTSKKKKEKRTSKSKRLSSSSPTNSSNFSLTKSNSSRTANSSSPDNSNNNNNILDAYGSKYVLPPPKVEPEERERDGLLTFSSADRNDPLAAYGGGADEFEDELDEIEMREEKRRNFDAFVSGDGAEQRTKMQKCWVGCKLYFVPLLICLLFLAGLVAGILYLVQGSSQKVQAVPVAPESLSVMCAAGIPIGQAHGDVSQFEMPTLCQEACQKGECCWNPEGDYVCTQDTLENCQAYKHDCGQWLEPEMQTEVPEFPAGLRTECARTAFEVSDGCREGCAQARCCWDDTMDSDGMCTSYFRTCLYYKEVCSFLNDPIHQEPVTASPNDNSAGQVESEIPFPPAPAGLDIYCDPSEMEEVSLHICEDKCAAAECCWKTGVESCVSTYPPQACHAYTQACGYLNAVSTAPGNTHDITSEEAPEGTESSTTNNVPEAPPGLANVCSKDTITDENTGGQSLIECEQACLKASCCWQPNAATPCPENARCVAYQEPCDIFVSLFDKPDNYEPETSETLPPFVVQDVPPAPSTMSMNCNPDVLTTTIENGKFIVNCERECLMGACCWKKNHPTTCPDSPQCPAYMEPCGEHLVNALLSLESPAAATTPPVTPAPTPSPPAVETNVPEAPQDIDMICNKDVLTVNVADGSFITHCEQECLEAACCWKENHATICPDAPQCANYMEPCKEHLLPVLMGLENPDSANDNSGADSSTSTNTAFDIAPVPNDMVLRCSMHNLSTNPDGREICEIACNAGDAACCWSMDGMDNDECSSDSNCVGYEICKNLEKTTPMTANMPRSPPDNIQEICSTTSLITMSGLAECKSACEEGDCCWLTGDKSCSSAAICQTYQDECRTLRAELGLANGASFSSSNGEFDGANTGGETVEGIQSACDDSTAFYLRSLCVQVCEAGDCCFDDPDSCPGSIDCNMYQPCAVLNDGNRRQLRHHR